MIMAPIKVAVNKEKVWTLCAWNKLFSNPKNLYKHKSERKTTYIW